MNTNAFLVCVVMATGVPIINLGSDERLSRVLSFYPSLSCLLQQQFNVFICGHNLGLCFKLYLNFARACRVTVSMTCDCK